MKMCGYVFVHSSRGITLVLTSSFLQADASVEMEQRYFAQASLEYVFLLQEVQERKKFEFVETVSTC